MRPRFLHIVSRALKYDPHILCAYYTTFLKYNGRKPKTFHSPFGAAAGGHDTKYGKSLGGPSPSERKIRQGEQEFHYF